MAAHLVRTHVEAALGQKDAIFFVECWIEDDGGLSELARSKQRRGRSERTSSRTVIASNSSS